MDDRVADRGRDRQVVVAACGLARRSRLGVRDLSGQWELMRGLRLGLLGERLATIGSCGL